VNFKEFLIKNNKLMDVSVINYSLQLISSSLVIMNSTSITGQNYILKGFLSNVTMDEVTIEKSTVFTSLINLASSSLSVRN